MLRKLTGLGPCARPARLCTPVKRLVSVRRSSLPHDEAARAESASATAASTAAAVNPDHSQCVQHDSLTTAAPDSRTPDKRDKKSKRKPSAPQSSTVLFEGAAAAAGPLPDVLAATFPATFPTLSAARRGRLEARNLPCVCSSHIIHELTVSQSARNKHALVIRNTYWSVLQLLRCGTRERMLFAALYFCTVSPDVLPSDPQGPHSC